MADAPSPQITQYTVNILNAENSTIRDWYNFDIRIERMTNTGLWAVRSMTACLSERGKWEHEPNPSSRTDKWLKAHRFDLDTALALATKHARTLEVNGRMALEFLKQ